MVVGLPARPHFLLLRVVVVGQLVQVVFDSLEHQVSRDLFRTARGNILSFSEVVGILELGIVYCWRQGIWSGAIQNSGLFWMEMRSAKCPGWQGFKDEDLGTSSGWWATTEANYCPSRPSQLTQKNISKRVDENRCSFSSTVYTYVLLKNQFGDLFKPY